MRVFVRSNVGVQARPKAVTCNDGLGRIGPVLVCFESFICRGQALNFGGSIFNEMGKELSDCATLCFAAIDDELVVWAITFEVKE